MLTVTYGDPIRASRALVSSPDPVLLASIPDVLAATICEPGDVLGCWALHPSEQVATDGPLYVEEQRALGANAHARIIERARPWRRNVVWVDRYNLIASPAPVTSGGPLMGLYAGSQGSVVMYAHPAAGAHAIAQHLEALAAGTIPIESWQDGPATMFVRWGLMYSSLLPYQVAMTHPAIVAPAVSQSLIALGRDR